MIVSYTKLAFERMILRNGVNQVLVENQIARKLMTLPSYPSQDEINDTFQDLDDVVQVPFTLDQNGKLQRISDVNKMTNGQAIWPKIK